MTSVPFVWSRKWLNSLESRKRTRLHLSIEEVGKSKLFLISFTEVSPWKHENRQKQLIDF